MGSFLTLRVAFTNTFLIIVIFKLENFLMDILRFLIHQNFFPLKHSFIMGKEISSSLIRVFFCLRTKYGNKEFLSWAGNFRI